MSISTRLVAVFAGAAVAGVLWAAAPPRVTSAAAADTPRAFKTPPALITTEQATAASAAAAANAGTCTQFAYAAKNGVVRLPLYIKYAENDIFDPTTGGNDHVRLRMYNGCLASPTIFTAPQTTLRIVLHNKLPTDDPTCTAGNQQGPGECFNTTNLHTHGLHVSPTGNSDNVLLSIAPGTNFENEINIPGDHPAGTFWYHAHRHGSTAVQVTSGMAGALIIKGNRAYADRAKNGNVVDVDTILHDSGQQPFVDRVMMLEQISYACFTDGSFVSPINPKAFANVVTNDVFNKATGTHFAPADAWYCPSKTNPSAADKTFLAKYPSSYLGVVEDFGDQLFSSTVWNDSQRWTTVNGVVQPTLGTAPDEVRAGQIQRWRFLHGGVHDTINVQVIRARAGAPPVPVGTRTAPIGVKTQAAWIAQNCPARDDAIVPQYEIAADGLTRASVYTIKGAGTDNTLQPGYRSDVLIAFPEAGQYCVIDQGAPQAATILRGANNLKPARILAMVNVTGDQKFDPTWANVAKQIADANADLQGTSVLSDLAAGKLTVFRGDHHDFRTTPQPVKPCPIATPPPVPVPITGRDKCVHFNITNPPLKFSINDNTYKPDVVYFRAQVGTIDNWRLTSSGEGHVFHIHVNPFEIMDVTDTSGKSVYGPSGVCAKGPSAPGYATAQQYCGQQFVFRDTLFVEAGYNMLVKTKYERYIGTFVLHCHILDHEDAGMMANVEIVPDAKALGSGYETHRGHAMPIKKPSAPAAPIHRM
jgi:FtsP/CotA-like multicopper oxidase with cupredoxin domain